MMPLLAFVTDDGIDWAIRPPSTQLASPMVVLVACPALQNLADDLPCRPCFSFSLLLFGGSASPPSLSPSFPQIANPTLALSPLHSFVSPTRKRA